MVLFLTHFTTGDSIDAVRCIGKVCANHDWWLVWLTVVLCIVTGALALYTARLYLATVKLGEEAKRTSERQSEEMVQSISEAARAAAAMQEISETLSRTADASFKSIELMRERTAAQLRPYVVVARVTATCLRTPLGARFIASPRIRNTGATPALRLGHRSMFGLRDAPLPDRSHLPLDLQSEIRVRMTVASGQEIDIHPGSADELVPDDYVAAIKTASGRALYVWGIIYYEDIFGVKHETSFAQQIFWTQPDGDETYSIFLPELESLS